MPSGSAASEGSEKAMKTRIITALIGMPIIVAVVLSAPLWASGLMLGVLCAIAALELMRAVEPGLQKRRAFWPMLSAFVMPLWLSIRGSGLRCGMLSGGAIRICGRIIRVELGGEAHP